MGEAGRHEVETNNWYNDISTRDRSREGAEEAIDLSRRFQKPELFKTRAGGRLRARSSGSRARTGRGFRAAAGALKLDINTI